MRKAMWILWPSFLVAVAATGLFFAAFDPWQLRLFDWAVYLSRTAVYSLGFIAFWALAAASSALTCFLQRSSEEVNRCPLAPFDRPPGCPKRAGAGDRV
jgi:hypothetical protein